MTTELKIRGKVARILNSREVAFNIGRHDGVEIGMLFDILAREAQDIMDPDTGMPIGSIERPKVRVQVTMVEDKVSLASTYRTTSTNRKRGNSSLHAWASLLSTAPKTLRSSANTWEELDEKDSYVATGDPVVQVLNDESHG